MKDCIEREAAIAVIEEKQKELCPVGMYSRHAVYGSDREKFDAWQEIIDALEAVPAADVRPVVLCRDCKYNTREVNDLFGNNAIQCITGLTHRHDWFCADGKKREES